MFTNDILAESKRIFCVNTIIIILSTVNLTLKICTLHTVAHCSIKFVP